MEMAMKGILAVFWLILVPVAVGRLPFVKRRQPLLTERFVSGYLILFSIMEVLTLPMTFLKMPLHVLVISYGSIALILALTGVFVTVKAKDTIRLSGIFDREKIYFWIALILILHRWQCVFYWHIWMQMMLFMWLRRPLVYRRIRSLKLSHIQDRSIMVLQADIYFLRSLYFLRW